MVFSEPTSEFLMALGRPDQNAAFDRDGRVIDPQSPEAILADDAFGQIAAAPPLPRVPAIVLSADKFAPPWRSHRTITRRRRYTPPTICWRPHWAPPMWSSPGTGHNQMLYQPQAVADQITGVVARVRDGN